MKKIFNAVCMAAILVFASSCIKDRQSDEGITGKPGDAEVILRLKTPGGFSAPGSRALTNEDENTINDIYVLVFDKTNTLVAIKQGEEVAYTVGSGDPLYSGTGSFSVTLEASKTTVDTYNLVVLANAETILSNTIGQNVSAIGDKGYSAVTSRIRASITGAMYASGGTIPMWGESGQTVIEPGGNNRTLTLTRSVARIDAGVGRAAKNSDTDAWSWDGRDAGGNTIPFTLTEVYIIRPNDRYAVIPDAALAAGSPTVPAGTAAFTVAASESAFAFAATVSAAGGFTSRDIYVPEADILMGVSGKPGDANHENRMAVIVGGSYNGGGTTYYRLDFAKDGDLMNVLRNHLYQFNISGVSGAGYPDVETAYKSLAMNMTVDILEWNESEIGEIVFDGQYMLAVNQGEFFFDRDPRAGDCGDNTLYVYTDYIASAGSVSGWYVDQQHNADNPGDPAAWLSLSRTSGAAGGKAGILLEFEENNSSSDRSAVVVIAAGRLRYSVTITQSATPALALSITDLNNKPVSDLLFGGGLGIKPAPQFIKVSWFPRDADLTVSTMQIGQQVFDLTEITPQFADIPDGNGGTGVAIYSIRPQAITANPGDTRSAVVTFSTTDGTGVETKSLTLTQEVYSFEADPLQSSYLLNGQTVTLTFNSTAPWTATLGGDTGILDGTLPALSGGAGSGAMSFQLITDNANVVRTRSLTITFNGKFGTKTVTLTGATLYLRLAQAAYNVGGYDATTINIGISTNLPSGLTGVTATVTNTGNGIITGASIVNPNLRITVGAAQSAAQTGTVRISYSSGSISLTDNINVSRAANPFTKIGSYWVSAPISATIINVANGNVSCPAGSSLPNSRAEVDGLRAAGAIGGNWQTYQGSFTGMNGENRVHDIWWSALQWVQVYDQNNTGITTRCIAR